MALKMDNALRGIGTLWLREVTRFCRQRSRVIGSFLQPLVFWLLLGAGLKASFRPAGMPADMNYFEYLYPGFITLVLLFTAIFSTISTVEDRREGFLQGVLVAPIARPTIVMGQALGATTLAWVPSCIFLLLAPFAGIHLSLAAILLSALVMAIVAFALTCIGLLIAWRIESTQGFHAIMNLILIPIWLLSGAFWPVAGAPLVLGWVMRINPLTYGVAALREGLYASHPGAIASLPAFGLSFAVAAVFALAMYAMAARVANRAVVT
ncbi:MAG TPA: ABC transporter permease [Candidatus Binataceae bacterium]|jgi:ABC-2 type transport system permease protein|nr:ABC transporter permease [Candidatus Binataceae bacterium]